MAKNQNCILVVCATEKELSDLDLGSFSNVETLVTGVGMVATTFSLTRKLAEKNFDFVINIGIAGSFDPKLKIGSVVQVVCDRFSELGVENHEQFIPADELGLVSTHNIVFFSEKKVLKLPQVAGITVNRVHGNAESIRKTAEQFNPDIESMEGAAIGFVCEPMGVPWVQIRAVSNKVEPRNRNNWNIPLALKNLHKEVGAYLKQLENEA